MSLCQFKDLFGKPNEGLHSIRLFGPYGGIAVVDTVLAVVLGLVLAKVFKLTKFNGILLSLILGIIAHRVFCVETTVDKFLKSKGL